MTLTITYITYLYTKGKIQWYSDIRTFLSRNIFFDTLFCLTYEELSVSDTDGLFLPQETV